MGLSPAWSKVPERDPLSKVVQGVVSGGPSGYPIQMRAAILMTGAFLIGACSEQSVAPIAVLVVQGAAIDGSEDVVPVPAPDPVANAVAEEERGTPTEETSEPEVPEPAEVVSEPEPPPAPEGPRDLTYRDLALLDYDVDAILDAMLFPEEYEGDDDPALKFPKDILELDGQEISIVGYMIPGEMNQGNVRDFMLVRDLLGCCFGGSPMPDEWIDVIMTEEADAEYRPYMPMRVTGVLTLGGEQDEAGFALGVYQLKGTDVIVED